MISAILCPRILFSPSWKQSARADDCTLPYIRPDHEEPLHETIRVHRSMLRIDSSDFFQAKSGMSLESKAVATCATLRSRARRRVQAIASQRAQVRSVGARPSTAPRFRVPLDTLETVARGTRCPLAPSSHSHLECVQVEVSMLQGSETRLWRPWTPR